MSKQYNIAIDVSPLSDGNSVRGVGYYTKNLVSALEEVTRLPEYQKYRIHFIDQASKKSRKYDLIHYPYFDPFFLTLPKTNDCPQVITIHDLIPRQFRSHFPVGIKGELRWLIQKHRARQSAKIITVSHYSKYVIGDILNYPLENIYVTYEDADDQYCSHYPQSQLNQLRKKYQLPPRFVLNNGDINWNKNIPSLVKACLQLGYPLVLVGSASTKKVDPHPWNNDIIWVQSQTSPLIHRLGFVPDEDLPLLYHLATIYCQPSYSEGFGLSLVKAMRTGTPVVYSQDSSLPEVMDHAGVEIDPYDLESLKSGLQKIWESDPLQTKYRQLGLKRQKFFSWKNTALQTLAVYESILSP